MIVTIMILFDTWKFDNEEKEKSLAIDDFLEQHDSEDTADTPGGDDGGDEGHCGHDEGADGDFDKMDQQTKLLASWLFSINCLR